MKDFEKDWNNYETTPIRQLDLFLSDILDTLQNRGADEALQYIRGLKDGNRFARKRPPIKEIGDV